MEELHRMHKDVPFGWVLWLQEAVTAGAALWRAREPGFRREAPARPIVDDLHCLSGPH